MASRSGHRKKKGSPNFEPPVPERGRGPLPGREKGGQTRCGKRQVGWLSKEKGDSRRGMCFSVRILRERIFLRPLKKPRHGRAGARCGKGGELLVVWVKGQPSYGFRQQGGNGSGDPGKGGLSGGPGKRRDGHQKAVGNKRVQLKRLGGVLVGKEN